MSLPAGARLGPYEIVALIDADIPILEQARAEYARLQ
jgi:hypothetical protein